jgi:hypothetical protein
MARPIRRVITGHDAKGKAIVVSDAPAPFMHANAVNPEWNSTDIWRTDGMPVVVRAQHGETTEGPRRQMPTKNGTVLRINNFPPETDAVNSMDVAAARKAFAALGNEKASTFGRGGRHPLMHRTETIDYAIILEGEIDMLLDDEDVHLKAGDIVIQCGTNHAWVNRSKAACRVAFILIDGKFDDELGAHFNQP